jgi:glucokinase
MKVVAGVDIGGTNTKIGLIDEHSKIVARTRFKTKSCKKYEDFVNAISQTIMGLLTPNQKLVGIGIGAPNGNFYSGCIEFAPNLQFKGVLPLRDSISKFFSCPVKLTNDANAAAIGEKVFGGAKNMNDFIVITLGTGVGSGIYANGQLVHGHDGFAGELGHVITFPNGRLCGCGRKGCLEPYANERGIRDTFLELKNDYPHSLLHHVDQINGFTISEKARENDELGIEVFKRTGKYLGFAFANFVATLSPQTIFIFGGISNAGELIMEPLKEEMEKNLLQVYRGKIEVRFSELPNDDAALLGAAALIMADGMFDKKKSSQQKKE